jgi:hypothetical protein
MTTDIVGQGTPPGEPVAIGIPVSVRFSSATKLYRRGRTRSRSDVDHDCLGLGGRCEG